MEHSLVTDIAICIIAAWVVAVASQVAKQPLLLAYLVAGFAVGPNGFKWVTNAQDIQTISEIGLSLLLFMIGLEIDLKNMLSAGRVITLTAGAQILGCVLLGWLIFAFLGPAQNHLEALYLAVAAAMSSTVIIVKILYDKRELETLAGRVTLGVLVLQDVATILFLAVQPNLKHPAAGVMLKAIGNVILLVLVAYMASRFVLPKVFKFIARLPELVLVGALAWCFAMAGFADWLKLSTAMGALIAGVMLSTFPYTLDVAAKVTSLRDFFVTLFFVGLGMLIPMPTVAVIFWTVFVCLVLIVTRLFTVFPVLYSMKQGCRVSLLSAVNLCQMSELSLVLLALGKTAGDVSSNVIGICAFAFAFLAIGSTYAIIANDALFRRITPLFKKLELHDLDHTAFLTKAEASRRRICLLGFSWTASSLLAEIERNRPELLPELCVIDFNPVVHEKLKARNIFAVYGDITARDVLHHAGASHAEVIICSLPNMVLKGANNLKILRQLRELNPHAQIIVHAELLSDVPALYAAGANFVTAPRLLEAADLLAALKSAEENVLDARRRDQEMVLQERNEVIP
ncbi:MAG TPA: cation:proton antiporter [Candidatus Sulfotelmatobacter sp.]|jgi:Kef-type K+ transport system membrane component KefB|nr:cation:proton antiporter [Candidatus Sulfotelmatobacter sp.]